MRTLLFAVVALAASTGFAQTAPKLQFEVASIRPTLEQAQGRAGAGIKVDGQQMHCEAFTLKEFIAIAYKLKITQVVGPDSISQQRYDINATLPAGSTPAQFADMLQVLLADRFGLKLHHDKKEFAVYALERGKGPLKLTETPIDANAPAAAPNSGFEASGSGSAAGVSVNLGNGSSYTFANNKFEVKKMTLALATSQMERYLDRPFVDATGLTGTYDFSIDISDEDYRVMLIRAAVASGVSLPPNATRLLEGSSLPSLMDGAEKIGLKIEARKAPLDVVVVDQIQKAPTDN